MYEIILELLGGSAYFPSSTNYAYNSTVQNVTAVVCCVCIPLVIYIFYRLIDKIITRGSR